MSTKTLDPELDVDILDKLEENAKIILYNDDYNSFDTVIEALCKYAGHDSIQAHQCALIVHEKGKYAVKQGDYDKLLPIKVALCESGLLAEID